MANPWRHVICDECWGKRHPEGRVPRYVRAVIDTLVVAGVVVIIVLLYLVVLRLTPP